MAGLASGPSGFSYAQAAKGRAAAMTATATAAAAAAAAATNTSSRPPSGTATPASAPTAAVDLTAPGGNWADDVEASVAGKTTEGPKTAAFADADKAAVPAKDTAVERAKLEDKTRGATTSGVSSPDLAASSSTTTNNDDASSAPTNGSSETTWETKSQTSEPVWIAERKERQSSSQNSDRTVKAGEKRAPDDAAAAAAASSQPPSPKPSVVLQEAAPPPVNPWAKRAEEQKAKLAAQQPPAKATATPGVPSAADSAAPPAKENPRTRIDPRKKAHSLAGAGVPRTGDRPIDAAGDARHPTGAQDSAAAAAPAASSAAPTSTPTHSSATPPTAAAASAPLVRDDGAWPTPDTAQEKERKDATEKETTPEKPSDDTAATTTTTTTKSHKKREWQPIAVTPNIIFETQNIRGRDSRGPPTGERGGRGGLRGRGGFRGGGNVNASNGGDRAGRVHASPHESDGPAAASRGRGDAADRDAMPPPSKPHRAASTNSFQRPDAEARPERNTRGHSLTESRSFPKGAKFDARAAENRKAASGWKDADTALPRAASPGKLDGSGPGAAEDERLPEPIPRRSSVAANNGEPAEPADRAARDGTPSARPAASEYRKDARGFENGFRESGFGGAPRGSKRGGRGRGGAREFASGHQGSHSYTNGDAPYNGVPSSPSAYPRGNHQFSYPPQGRGGWSRGNPRSHSIAMDGFYSRYPAPPYGQHLPPVHTTYMPGMYDYSAYPMTAMPFSPYMEQQYLMDMVSTQLEYYFSIDNLLKDMFLRKHMDSQGFVFLDVIANFNRIKQLTQDTDVLRAVCLNSETIEIVIGEDGKERLRRREGWEQFLLRVDQREPSAQNDGPQQLQRPERPAVGPYAAPSPSRGAPAAGYTGVPPPPPRFDRRSYDAGYPMMMNGVPPPFAGYGPVPDGGYGDGVNGEEMRGRPTQSPLRDPALSPTQPVPMDPPETADAEPDVFPDEQANQLTVVVKMVRDGAPPHHHAGSRTLSSGSIDSRHIFTEMEKAGEHPPAAAAEDGEAAAPNGVDSSAASSRHASPNGGNSLDRVDGAPNVIIKWVKDEITAAPSNGQPEGFTAEPYVTLRFKALDQRAHAATGTCPYDLDVLYQFWAHFLLRNFNARMYGEFKHFATADGHERHNFIGLDNLVKFYDHSLLSAHEMRDRLVHDYVALVHTEPAELGGVAFKHLRSAWRNGALNLKNRKKLSDVLDQPLKARLDHIET